MYAPVKYDELTVTKAQLDKALDRTKTEVFKLSSAAFLGSIMCSMTFSWTMDIPTACTDGINIWWNPEWFVQLLPQTRTTVMVHEIWHVAYMHMVRRGNRDPLWWNIACDYAINNRLLADGYDFTDTGGLLDPQFSPDMGAEQIYDKIYNKSKSPSNFPWGMQGACTGNNSGNGQSNNGSGSGPQNQNTKPGHNTDMIEPESAASQQAVVNTVVRAVHTAKMSAGSIPGDIENTVKEFLNPVLPWHVLMLNWLTELGEEEYTWRRPNRRYTEMYLPSLDPQESRLTHLIYYQDASGSISQEEMIRFNSELKYIWEEFKPLKMTIVIFDTTIRDEIVFEDGDEFEKIVIRAGGGTSLYDVREHIMKHNPTAAVIFSDLYVTPMKEGPKCPVLWVAINNPSAKVNFGKLIHLAC